MNHSVRLSSRDYLENWLNFIEEALKEVGTHREIEMIVTPDCTVDSIASAKIVHGHLLVLEETLRIHAIQWRQYYALDALGELTADEIRKVKEFLRKEKANENP